MEPGLMQGCGGRHAGGCVEAVWVKAHWGLGGGAGLLLVPDDEVEEVLGEVSPSRVQGAAQFPPAVAEGAGEVEIFVAATEREQGHSAPIPHLSHPASAKPHFYC